MLAFFNNPVQLIIVLMILLLLFGPEKLPEMGKQLGKALRDLKKAGQEFTDTVNFDDTHEPPKSYEPPNYESYNQPYQGEYNSYMNSSQPSYGDMGDTNSNGNGNGNGTNSTEVRGDFAAPALADISSEFTLAPSEGAVPRSKT